MLDIDGSEQKCHWCFQTQLQLALNSSTDWHPDDCEFSRCQAPAVVPKVKRSETALARSQPIDASHTLGLDEAHAPRISIRHMSGSGSCSRLRQSPPEPLDNSARQFGIMRCPEGHPPAPRGIARGLSLPHANPDHRILLFNARRQHAAQAMRRLLGSCHEPYHDHGQAFAPLPAPTPVLHPLHETCG